MLGYGGAGGGGKTDLLLGLSVEDHLVSKIFRREATQLRDIIERSKQIIGDYGRLNENTGVWRDLPGGRRLDLLGVKDEADVEKHRGRAADLYGFDEATEFSENQVRFITGWNRSTVIGQRCRVVLCFNPPSTVEGRWIIKFFGPWLDPTHPNPAKPGELRYFATLPGGKEIERPDGKPFAFEDETIVPRSRTFMPARLQDNPYLRDSGYVAVLQSLPEPLRSQLLKGDFNAGITDDPWQVIPTKWVQMAQARWLARRAKHAGPPKGLKLDALGVDVARGGSNRTAIAPRYGFWFDEIKCWEGIITDDGPKVAALVIQELGASKGYVNIDIIGVGGSAYDSLVAFDIRVCGVNNGGGPTEGYTDRSGKLKMVNKRAENYWRLREALEPGKGDNLELPPSQSLLGDLTAAKWKLTTRGVIVEPKEDIVKRLGRSPDEGDALLNAHAPPDAGEFTLGDFSFGGEEQKSGWRNK